MTADLTTRTPGRQCPATGHLKPLQDLGTNKVLIDPDFFKKSHLDSPKPINGGRLFASLLLNVLDFRYNN